MLWPSPTGKRIFSGLIDEFFGIRNNAVKLPSDKFISADEAEGSASLAESSTVGSARPAVKQFVLSSSEELYADLRDKNFNAVGPTLSKKAKAVSAQFEERHGAKTVRDFKMFVDKLPQMQVTIKC